jgi:hypothetical protein
MSSTKMPVRPRAVPVGGSARLEEAEGSTTVSRPTAHVIVFRSVGYLTLAQARFALDASDAILAETSAPLHGFYDWSGMTGYALQARLSSTTWMLMARRRFACVSVFAKERLVSMAVSVANIAFEGWLAAPRDAETFKQALDAACAADRRRVGRRR